MPNMRLIRAAVKPAFRHEQTHTQTDRQTDTQIAILYIYRYIYIYKIAICLSVCMYVCLCLNAGLTAARINLIFGMHTLIWSDCAIGYMILTFKVIKGHFRTNKFLCKVPSEVVKSENKPKKKE